MWLSEYQYTLMSDKNTDYTVDGKIKLEDAVLK